jgi:hydrogenase maturation protein HypF
LNYNNENTALKIKVKGLVQGVGFRPFIYRLAFQHGISGWVENRNDGVIIQGEGSSEKLDNFVIGIRNDAPQASNIFSITKEKVESNGFSDFQIIKSENTSTEITDVSPDIAVCDACIEDLKLQAHRIDYPFTNCTNCGPRFSIIKDLPYDRHKTTMKPFVMCNVCQKEYEDVLDRRFHAQPVACNTCGPEYELIIGKQRISDFKIILKHCVDLIKDGKILAIKGIGGFQLACDAMNESVVKTLRQRKVREGKPFAVMFRNIDTLKEYLNISPEEEKSVLSWRRPIVIANTKKELASGISIGFKTIGAMLPYMPFHYQLFEKLDVPAIVLTSGNLSDEPIVIDNDIAEKSLSSIADAVLIYNREIYNRTDDSVAMIVNEKERLIRRSRSYSPEPINLNYNVDGIVAAGAELVNCFCIGKAKQAILSQHIGDLKNLETLEFYEESYKRFLKLFRMEPQIVACDKHPDYLSSKFAKELGLQTVEVQHHHAHIAACMAEFNLDEKVIGVSMDGTGLGDDGNIWGGEFLIADLAGYERFTHFEYIPLPGGDKVTKEPWRTGLSILFQMYGDKLLDLDLDFLKSTPEHNVDLILQAIKKNINCPLSSSAGRLFDAVAAITNICPVSTFHAEAPMRLESVAHENVQFSYSFDFGEQISFRSTIQAIIDDLHFNVPVSEISAKFHNTFINVIFAVASQVRKTKGINKVVLSGGTFQNKYILSRLEKLLIKEGFEVYAHSKVPSNDAGVALGQLVVAAKRRELGLL